jgi:AraC-like DNA-binding protein
MTDLDVEGNIVLINPLMQTNLRVLSGTPFSPRVASTDYVRFEMLRCPPDTTVQWRIPKAKVGLIWVRDRRGSVRVLSGDHSTEELRTGDANLWFFPENLATEGEIVGSSAINCIGLFVEPSFVPQPVRNELADPIVGLSDSTLGRTFNALTGQLAELAEPEPMYIEGWAIQVLARVGRGQRMARSSRQTRMSGLAAWQLRRAKEMLLADISGHLPLSELATACRLSVSHFLRAFRASTGTPPRRWLIAQRVNNAQKLLAQSEVPLSEIAYTCGFADQSHFSRVFARISGTTPSVWRREHGCKDCAPQSDVSGGRTAATQRQMEDWL